MSVEAILMHFETIFACKIRFIVRHFMEGDLSKKSIHINESFVHAIYIGIVVNSYSDIVANI